MPATSLRKAAWTFAAAFWWALLIGCSGSGTTDGSGRAASGPAASGPAASGIVDKTGAPGARDHRNATFVGRDVCAGCHAQQHDLWSGSHHDLAMQAVGPDTVLGDFDDASFTYYGVTSTFYRRGQEFWVRTDGPDGGLEDYRIEYAFGVDPLQQYLVEFPGGRYQVLSLCWDTRPVDEGGQRWFHLYPDEPIDHRDELHWTGPNQNWNFMCADCHSTNLAKNYRFELDAYETTWSEMDVSCEACHGPGSQHVAWATDSGRRDTTADAASREAGAGPRGANLGLQVRFEGGTRGSWQMTGDDGIARLTAPRDATAEIDTCGHCHSRRTPLTPDYRHGLPLADTHRVALLEEGLYHADGQIQDEVYVYGSFLQSRMHAAGVTCTDCHEPHGGDLIAKGDLVCSRCHDLGRFASTEHHFHDPAKQGASCIGCHMLARDYMVIDRRHDHGFRVPRPDLTARFGTPSTCTDCHADRPAEWAAARFERWYGPPAPSGATAVVAALHAGRELAPDAGRHLTRLAADGQASGIARATALSLLGSGIDPGSPGVVHGALGDPDPLVRAGALEALALADPDTRLRLAYPLVQDPVRRVRLAAASVLAGVPDVRISPAQRSVLSNAFAEYEQAQWTNADRAHAHLNLGWLASQRGRTDEAERAYRRALRLEPDFIPAYVNLADLYRSLGRDGDGEIILRRALDLRPETASIHHALGLLLARRQKTDEAIEALARAFELEPGEPRYAYVYGVALHSAGRFDRAIAVLEQAHRRHPAAPEPLFALVSFHRDAGQIEQARKWAARFLEAAPGDPRAQALVSELQ